MSIALINTLLHDAVRYNELGQQPGCCNAIMISESMAYHAYLRMHNAIVEALRNGVECDAASIHTAEDEPEDDVYLSSTWIDDSKVLYVVRQAHNIDPDAKEDEMPYISVEAPVENEALKKGWTNLELMQALERVYRQFFPA